MANIIMEDVKGGGGAGLEDALITRSISEITNNTVSTIGAFAFCSFGTLTAVSFAAVTNTGKGAFQSCSNLTTINFPALNTIGERTFQQCFGLTAVSISAAKDIGSNAFANCTHLTTASFPAATNIGSNTFAYCYKLTSLYLMGSSFVTLANTNAFNSTPISNYTTSTGGVYGTIYVPSSMLSSYKTRTNWSTFSARFVGV